MSIQHDPDLAHKVRQSLGKSLESRDTGKRDPESLRQSQGRCYSDANTRKGSRSYPDGYQFYVCPLPTAGFQQKINRPQEPGRVRFERRVTEFRDNLPTGHEGYASAWC
jgi:hypothetical protein